MIQVHHNWIYTYINNVGSGSSREESGMSESVCWNDALLALFCVDY